MSELNFLERVTPDTVQYGLWQEHINRYTFALKFISGKAVLDVACGTGYGTELMSKAAELVVGVDESHEALTYAKDHYGNLNTEFVLADAHNLPFRESVFDVVISFETIEHLTNYTIFLQQIKHILKTGENLIISTPNSEVTIPTEKGKPSNPFHHREFNRNEFSQLLREFSLRMQFYGQCPFTVKDRLLRFLGNQLSSSFLDSMRKLTKATFETKILQQSTNIKTIDPAYQVKKIRFNQIYPHRFILVIIKNEK